MKYTLPLKNLLEGLIVKIILVYRSLHLPNTFKLHLFLRKKISRQNSYIKETYIFFESISFASEYVHNFQDRTYRIALFLDSCPTSRYAESEEFRIITS